MKHYKRIFSGQMFLSLTCWGVMLFAFNMSFMSPTFNATAQEAAEEAEKAAEEAAEKAAEEAAEAAEKAAEEAAEAAAKAAEEAAEKAAEEAAEAAEKAAEEAAEEASDQAAESAEQAAEEAAEEASDQAAEAAEQAAEEAAEEASDQAAESAEQAAEEAAEEASDQAAESAEQAAEEAAEEASDQAAESAEQAAEEAAEEASDQAAEAAEQAAEEAAEEASDQAAESAEQAAEEAAEEASDQAAESAEQAAEEAAEEASDQAEEAAEQAAEEAEQAAEEASEQAAEAAEEASNQAAEAAEKAAEEAEEAAEQAAENAEKAEENASEAEEGASEEAEEGAEEKLEKIQEGSEYTNVGERTENNGHGETAREDREDREAREDREDKESDKKEYEKPEETKKNIQNANLRNKERVIREERFREVSDIYDDNGFDAIGDEILVLAENNAEEHIDNANYEVSERQYLEGLDLVLIRMKGAKDTELSQSAMEMSEAGTDRDADLNHLFTPQSRNENFVNDAHTKTDLSTKMDFSARHADKINLGLIDTLVEHSHQAFPHENIMVKDLVPYDRQRPTAHGTAVASILVGNDQDAYQGLIPGAKLYAASVFFKTSSDKVVATTESLILALDWLVRQKVQVINMSLSGPPNRLLEVALKRVAEKGSLVVAAVGNAGPAAAPLYPAAYPSVVAVTAVDDKHNVYLRANRGGHVAFAAPGVNIPTANAGGGYKLQSGTSMAAPFVSAILADLCNVNGMQDQDRLLKTLKKNAIDLGNPGHDDVYGFGFIRTSSH